MLCILKILNIILNIQDVKDLGGIVEESWENCTHLVTDKIRRTVKFLCVLATGKKIVSLNWVKASKKAGKFLGIYLIVNKYNNFSCCYCYIFY